MTTHNNEATKRQVHDYWNSQACGTNVTDKAKYSRDYFDEIERHRYSVEPEIRPFAEFEKSTGKKVLEVGIGASTDFLQWARAGARAYGVDLTPEAVEHAKQRLEVYGLSAEEIRVADCESLPYDDDTFDMVYSWGVIHHTPNTRQALDEIVRVTRPGGICKIMVYNRYSLTAFYLWVKKALFTGRPWKSFAWCIYYFRESTGTKAFTVKEVKRMLSDLPVQQARVESVLTIYDRLGSHGRVFQLAAGILAHLFGGDRAGSFMLIQFSKKS